MPVFVLDDAAARRPLTRPATATRFLLECLATCARRCSSAAGNLVIVRGAPERELPKLAHEHGATRGLLRLRRLAVRDGAATSASRRRCARRASSRAARPGTSSPTSASPSPTPSSRRSGGPGSELPRREVHGAPRAVPSPSDLRVGRDPARAKRRDVPDPLPGGETRRPRAHARLAARRHRRPTRAPRPARRRHVACSRPTCTSAALSARELEERPAASDAYTRQLAWRDFYAHVLLHNPDNARHAYRRELDAIEWDGERRALRRLARGPHRLSGRRRRACASSPRPAGCTTARG